VIASFLLVGEQPYAAMMVASVKAVHDCKVVQMSDLRTPAVAGVDEVVRMPFRIPLMLYRLRHLASYKHDEMLILDTDVICKEPIDDVLEQDFDIALTMRDAGEMYDGDGKDVGGGMPFNTGVMISRSADFWAECHNWLSGESAELQNWYGDQRAVFEVTQRGHYRTLCMPCSEFNWAPSHRHDSSPARFWHYKGAVRKKWIPSGYSSDSTSGKPLPITCSASPS
jgi:hypothetical protein